MTVPLHPTDLVPDRLRCEALTDPLGITAVRPRLSWIVRSESRGKTQTAYQVHAAASSGDLEAGRVDLWDSGKVASDETIAIEYLGQPLKPSQRCWWNVRVWDEADRPSPWSAPAVFGAGPAPEDWAAEWIGFDQTREIAVPPAPFDGASWIWCAGTSPVPDHCVFRGTLTLPEDVQVAHAEIALSIAGRYRFFWGPEQFGTNDDDPEPWRRPYMRDMTERLHPGLNQVVIKAERIDRRPAGLLCKLAVLAEDGRVFTLVSDEHWRATDQVTDDWYLCHGADIWPHCTVVAQYGEQPWGFLRGTKNFLPPPAYLRGTFSVDGPIRQATLFATALGWFDARINGARINDSYFDPGWTDYRKRVYYRAYDVTETLRNGENVLGAALADGWFSGYIGWHHQRDTYGKHPRFRGQLHIEYTDGSSRVLGTDPTWRAAIGPIKEADILMGEYYDAREELAGWDQPGFDDSGWHQVATGASLHPVVEPHPAPPVVALREESFTPVSITEPLPGVFIFDLGQNFSGIARLTVRGAVSGQRVTLRFGERLYPDGTLYTRNLRTARAADTYICRGDSEESWSPRFTFHGFQYVEVTGLPRRPGADTLLGIPLSSNTPRAGDFHCSDALANRLASNVYWSQRSNYIDIPTDCPQRDERLGWGDGAQTFIRAAAMRADVQTFYNKWAIDMDDAQYPDGLFPWTAPLAVTTEDIGGPMWAGSSPGWADAGVICPWSIYDLYGDRRQLAVHYPAMVRLVEWYRATSRPDLLPPAEHKCLSDWLSYGEETPVDVFRTLFFAHSTDLVARSAAVLGREEDAAHYRQLHEAIKEAFKTAYVQPDGVITGDTQTCYALAIIFEMLDEASTASAAARLIETIRRRAWTPTTGLEGTLPLLLALSRIGRNDVAYRLLHNDRFPSWNFSIKNGATTIWERWNSWTPEEGFGDAWMNSFNHFSLGAVYQWMVEQIGGIQSDGTAYKGVIIAPSPGGNVSHASVSYDSVRGHIATEWAVTGHVLTVRVTIPANVQARIVLPASRAAVVTEGGCPLDSVRGLSRLTREAGRMLLNASSGTFHFEVRERS